MKCIFFKRCQAFASNLTADKRLWSSAVSLLPEALSFKQDQLKTRSFSFRLKRLICFLTQRRLLPEIILEILFSFHSLSCLKDPGEGASLTYIFNKGGCQSDSDLTLVNSPVVFGCYFSIEMCMDMIWGFHGSTGNVRVMGLISWEQTWKYFFVGFTFMEHRSIEFVGQGILANSRKTGCATNIF